MDTGDPLAHYCHDHMSLATVPGLAAPGTTGGLICPSPTPSARCPAVHSRAQIALDDHARYRKSYAVLLPLLAPTLVAGAHAWGNTSAGGDGDGGGPGAVPFWREAWWQAATVAGAAVSLVVVVWYPRKGHLHGWAAGGWSGGRGLTRLYTCRFGQVTVVWYPRKGHLHGWAAGKWGGLQGRCIAATGRLKGPA